MTGLWEQTVTRYRSDGSRLVLTHCVYQWKDKKEEGSRFVREFLLLVPGAADLLPGDRIWVGEGPENLDWERDVPVAVPGLSQVGWVRQCPVGGQIHHTEAGDWRR